MHFGVESTFLRFTDTFKSVPVTQPIGTISGWNVVQTFGLDPAKWASTPTQACINDGSTLGSGAGPWDAPYRCNNDKGVIFNTRTESTCPVNFTKLGSLCVPNAGAPLVDKTPFEAESAIASKPVSGASDSASSFDDELSELVKSGCYPDTDGNTPVLTGPTASVQGEKSTEVAPDGSVKTVNNTYTNTYTNNYVETSQVTTTTVTPASGTPATTVTTTSPNTTAPTKEQLTDCEKFPLSIGCSQYGTVPAAETIPVTAIPATMTYTTWGNGSCPNPLQAPIVSYLTINLCVTSWF